MDKQRFRMVVGIDFREGSGHAVEEAASLAARSAEGTELHFVTAIVPHGDASRQEEQLAHVPAEMRQFVLAHRGDARQVHPLRFGWHARLGKPAQVLAQTAVDVEADLIVVGPHARGVIVQRPLGKVTRKLLREAHCPVLIARPKQYFDLTKSDVVDPPCLACVRTRAQTEGEEMWCDLHARPHADRSLEWSHPTRWSSIPPSGKPGKYKVY